MGKTVNNVNHPNHYNHDGGVECIDALKSALGPEGFKGFCAGNVIKYTWRYPHKNRIEDCKKAKWYLDTLIKELESEVKK